MSPADVLDATHRRRPRLRLAVLLVVWAVPAAVMLLQMECMALIDGQPLHTWRSLVPAVLEWLVWIPATPLIFWLVDRFPVAPRPRATAVFVHAIGIVAASGVRGLVYAASTYAITGPVSQLSFKIYLVRVVLGWLPVAVLLYGAVAAAALAMSYAASVNASALQTADLRAELSRAELRALRAQLHPHFLFNALHSISGLVRTNSSTQAVDALAGLGDLLRQLLTRPSTEHIRLADEVEFVRRYLALEQIRFSDRLQVHWSIAPDTADALIPALILQPLVENALRHGVSATIDAGCIGIATSRHGEQLELAVSDDGPGPSNDAPIAGFGLEATRARLRRYFGDQASLSLEAGSNGGAVARIRIPLRAA